MQNSNSLTATILMIEDETSIREMVAFTLEDLDYQLLQAPDCEQANALLSNHSVDLILLDWMLPKRSGITFLKSLKNENKGKWAHIPVIMLTAKADEDSRVNGLLAGADDYITKPFSTRELLARIQAVLRRTRAEQSGVFSYGPLTLDNEKYLATAQGVELKLTAIEFKLLHLLLKNPNRVFSRETLLDQVWEEGQFYNDRTVDVRIKRLRSALKTVQLDHMLQTIRGIGYKLTLAQTTEDGSCE